MDNQLCREILKNRDIKRQRKIDEAIIKKRKIYKDQRIECTLLCSLCDQSKRHGICGLNKDK